MQFVEPPASAAVGERIVVEGCVGAPEAVVNPSKKNNAWTACAPLLRTNADRVACFGGKPLVAEKSGQACTAPTVTEGPIS